MIRGKSLQNNTTRINSTTIWHLQTSWYYSDIFLFLFKWLNLECISHHIRNFCTSLILFDPQFYVEIYGKKLSSELNCRKSSEKKPLQVSVSTLNFLHSQGVRLHPGHDSCWPFCWCFVATLVYWGLVHLDQLEISSIATTLYWFGL